MSRLVLDPEAPSAEGLERAAACIRGGGVVCFPTETFYGLAVDPFQPAALERVYRIKGRDAGKPLGLICCGVEQLELVTPRVPILAMRLSARFWPGPLSLIFDAVEELPWQTVAVRVSGLVLARRLAEAARVPITATSANSSGAPPPTRLADLDPKLALSIDLLLDGGEVPGGAPSTMVDVRGETPRLVRAGRTKFSEIQQFVDYS